MWGQVNVPVWDEGRTGVGAVEHAGEVGAGGGVHELLLRCLFHDAVRGLQCQDGPVDAHWVPYLDGRREGRLRRHRFEVLPPLRARITTARRPALAGKTTRDCLGVPGPALDHLSGTAKPLVCCV